MLDAAAQGRRGGTGCRGSDRRARTLGRSLSHGLMTVPGRGRAARPGVGSSGPHWLTSGASWIWKSLWNQSSHHPLPASLCPAVPLLPVPRTECFVDGNASLPILIRDVAKHLS